MRNWYSPFTDFSKRFIFIHFFSIVPLKQLPHPTTAKQGKREKQICWQAVCHFLSGDSPGKDTAVLVHSAVLICYMSAHYFPRTWITLDSIIKCHVFTCYGAKLLLRVPPGIYTQPWWGREWWLKMEPALNFQWGRTIVSDFSGALSVRQCLSLNL